MPVHGTSRNQRAKFERMIIANRMRTPGHRCTSPMPPCDGRPHQWSYIARCLQVDRMTCWNYKREIIELKEQGYWDDERGPLATPSKARTSWTPGSSGASDEHLVPIDAPEWTDETKAMAEDTPEGFERFFNVCAPLTDPNVTKLADHSRMFVEAAYFRCPKHPRLILAGERPLRTGSGGPSNADTEPSGGSEVDSPPIFPDVWSAEVLAASALTAVCSDCGWKNRVMVNAPPAYAKSAVFCVWMSAWRLCQDRDHKRIVISDTETMAKSFVAEVALILETNEKVLEHFGAFFRKQDPTVVWRPSMGQIRVAGTKISRGYNLMARGMDGQITSLRADEVVCDDMVDPNSVNSELQRKKDSDKFHNVILTRAAGGRLWVLGTIWHPMDLYAELREKKREDGETPVWETIRFPAVLDWASQTTLWPEAWPFDKLMRDVYDSIGSSRFSLTYQQEPMSGDDVLARKLWIYGKPDDDDPNRGCLDRFRTLEPMPIPQGAVRALRFDPSPSKWAAVVIGDIFVDRWHGKLREDARYHEIVRYLERWKGGIREAVMAFEGLFAAYRPDYLVIETNSFAREYAANPDMQRLCAEYQCRMISHDTNRNKKDRILGVQSLARDFEFGQIRLPYGDFEAKQRSELLIHEASNWIMPDGSISATTDVLMSLWFGKAAIDRLRDFKRSVESTRAGGGFRVPAHLQGRRWNG